MSEEVIEEVEEQQEDSEGIERASRQGWTDKDSWVESGRDPEQWVDYQTFLKRGDEILPIVRANNKKLEEEVSKLKAEREQDKRIFDEFRQFQEEAKKRADKEYKQELEAIRKEKAAAVKSGDEVAFNQAEEKEDKLRDERQKSEPPPPKKSDVHPDFDPWLEKNTWYNDNRIARALANDIGAELSSDPKKLHLQGEAFFEEVAKQVQEQMPEIFENPNRRKPPAVEPGSNGRSRKPKGKSYHDLPADAKNACDNFCKTIPGFTKEQYVQDFDWSQI